MKIHFAAALLFTTSSVIASGVVGPLEDGAESPQLALDTFVEAAAQGDMRRALGVLSPDDRRRFMLMGLLIAGSVLENQTEADTTIGAIQLAPELDLDAYRAAFDRLLNGIEEPDWTSFKQWLMSINRLRGDAEALNAALRQRFPDQTLEDSRRVEQFHRHQLAESIFTESLLKPLSRLEFGPITPAGDFYYARVVGMKDAYAWLSQSAGKWYVTDLVKLPPN